MVGKGTIRIAVLTATVALPLNVVALTALAVSPVRVAAAAGWSIAPSQDPDNVDNRLYGVACSTPTTCWAVGDYFNGTAYQTLVEQWTQSGWVVVPSPDNSSTSTTNGNEDNTLTSITCVASGPCFAAGYWYDGQNEAHTLIEEDTGAGWQLMTSADVAPAVVDDLLQGITCISASDCWAVGETLVPGFFGIPFVPVPGTPAQTLTEHWNGTQWSVVMSADSGFSENILDGVACISSSNCWAAGINSNGSSGYDALIEQYNGTSWSIVNGADPSSQLNELDSAWCSSDGTCRAAGIERGASATQTLIEQTTSSAWVSDAGADTSSTQLNGTTGVTCVDDSDCWAVGEYDATGNFLFQTLVEQRTAAGWTVVPSGNVSTTQPDVLWGVGCASATACWSVGYSTDAKGVIHTLIEGNAVPAPVQTPDMPPLFAIPIALAAAVGVRRVARRQRQG
ncbi:MAG: hypothetical protein JOY80_07860 [Candidatus Dormibacteraeota bacterium]|nr:hypothetical protein [Candidatus Dormibacteraeota bacterium]